MNRIPHGLTILEVIISIFIVLSGFLVMMLLFNSALNAQSRVSQANTAALLAERQMEKIRGWSRQVHHAPGASSTFNDAGWASCPGASGPTEAPDAPGYTISVTTAAQTLYSPCSKFELENIPVRPVSQQRRVTNSVRKVTVLVTWGHLQYGLVSLVALPTPADPGDHGRPINVTMSANSIPSGGQSTGSANYTDADSSAVSDLFYDWRITGNCSLPTFTDPVGAGSGSFNPPPSRDGRTALINNFVYATIPNDTNTQNLTWAPGYTLFVATGRYRGRRMEGATKLYMQP